MGIERELTERFRALVSHYLFEPCCARPGEGHDKGGVEARGKAIRLQHLTPNPQGESLAAIAQAVQGELDRAFAAKLDAEGGARQRALGSGVATGPAAARRGILPRTASSW